MYERDSQTHRQTDRQTDTALRLRQKPNTGRTTVPLNGTRINCVSCYKRRRRWYRRNGKPSRKRRWWSARTARTAVSGCALWQRDMWYPWRCRRQHYDYQQLRRLATGSLSCVQKNKNLAIANRSRVSCAHNTSMANEEATSLLHGPVSDLLTELSTFQRHLLGTHCQLTFVIVVVRQRLRNISRLSCFM